MVLGQVREDGDIEIDAGDALLFERVRADLEHAGPAAAAHHGGHHLLDFQGFRRGPQGGDDAVTDLVAHRAEQAGFGPGGFEEFLDHEGDGGLAVGAGDADDLQFRGGMIVERGRRAGQAVRTSATFTLVARVEVKPLRSQMTAEAPRSIALLMKSCPSVCAPGIATNTMPGVTRRES